MTVTFEKQVKVTIDGAEVDLVGEIFELARWYIRENKTPGPEPGTYSVGSYGPGVMRNIENFIDDWFEHV